jgi:hypothetical protein
MDKDFSITLKQLYIYVMHLLAISLPVYLKITLEVTPDFFPSPQF